MRTILLATLMTVINFNEIGMVLFGIWWVTGASCMRYPPTRNFLIAFYIVGGFWYGLAGAWG